MKVLCKKALSYTLSLAIIISSVMCLGGITQVLAQENTNSLAGLSVLVSGDSIAAGWRDTYKEKTTVNIWDGVTKTKPSGDGSVLSPYLISNGAELGLAVSSGGGNDVYYEITKDIYLNDLSKINWRSGAVLKAYEADGLNTWYGSKTVFAGNVEGNGHTVYGLYRYEANALKEYVTNYNYGGGLSLRLQRVTPLTFQTLQ